MRIVVLSLIGLVLYVGVAVCRFESVAHDQNGRESRADRDEWRRTADGWEKDVLAPASPSGVALPHPAWLATAQLLFSLTAMTAGERSRAKRIT